MRSWEIQISLVLVGVVSVQNFARYASVDLDLSEQTFRKQIDYFDKSQYFDRCHSNKTQTLYKYIYIENIK